MSDKTKERRGGPRDGSGRPRKLAAEKQSARVMTTFTPAEHQELKKDAGDVPLSSFIRGIVLRYMTRKRQRK